MSRYTEFRRNTKEQHLADVLAANKQRAADHEAALIEDAAWEKAEWDRQRQEAICYEQHPPKQILHCGVMRDGQQYAEWAASDDVEPGWTALDYACFRYTDEHATSDREFELLYGEAGGEARMARRRISERKDS